MASIEKRRTPSGAQRYEVRWRDRDGRDRSRTFRRKAEADAHKSAVEGERWGGAAVATNQRVTVREWSEQWLAGEVHRLAPKTLSGYRSRLKSWILPSLGDSTLHRLSPGLLRDWMAMIVTEGCSPASAAHARRTLHRMLEVAVHAELLVRNPCTSAVVVPRSEHREVDPLTPKQLVALAGQIGPMWSALVLVAGTGGPRLAELGALRRSDVTNDGRTISITETMHGRGVRRGPKTKAGRRSLTLPPMAAKALVDHMKLRVDARSDALLWPSLISSNTNFRRIWVRATTAIGTPDLRFHDLRHTAISIAIAAGADPKAVQAMAGHSTLALTLGRYGHLFPSSSDAVAEAVQRALEA